MKQLLLVLITFISITANAINYYVLPSGNNANDGLTEQTSFKTIHWGSFALALHTWDDPILRVTKKA